MIKHFFRDSAIYLIPNVISRGLAFFLVPLYTRILAPSDFGAMDLINIFGYLVGLVVPLEISQGMARYFAEAGTTDEKRKYSSTSWVFTIFSFACFLIFAFLFSSFFVGIVVGDKEYEAVFRLSLLFIFFNGLFYLMQNQLRWELRSKDYAKLSFFFTVSNIFGAAFFALYLQMGLTGIVLSQVLSGGASCLIGWYLVFDSFKFKVDIPALKEMLLFSLPLVPSSIAVFVFTYINRIMINNMLGMDDVGLFGIANRLCSAITLAISGFQIALTPLIYAYYRESETPRKLARIFRYFVSFSLLATLSLSLFSREIIMLMTTPDYYSSAKLVPFLAPGVLLINMYIFAPGISIRKKTHLILLINVGGGALNIAFNYLFINLIGLTGAAVATLLTGLCLFTANMIFSQKLYYVPHQWMKVLTATAGCFLLYYVSGLLFFSPVANFILKSLIVVIFSIVLVILGMIKKQEIVQIYRLLRVNVANISLRSS